METVWNILVISLGGALGAVTRYLIGISALASPARSFPWPTFVINLTGSFLIGILFVITTERGLGSENVRLALMVGFVGAFTTFSTFELEIWSLIRDGNYILSFIYLLASVTLGFAALVAGIGIGRRLV